MPNRVSDDLIAPCPFCARDVDKELVVYGGKCPHCFGEIPGEEAPTDPGEERRMAETAAAKKKVERAKRVPLLLAGIALMVPILGAVGLVAMRSSEVMPALNLDDAEYDMGDVGQLRAYVEPTPPTEAVKSGKGKTKSQTAKAPDGATKPPTADITQVGGSLLGSDDPTTIDIRGPGGTADAHMGKAPRGPGTTVAGGPDALPEIGSTASGGSADLELSFDVQRRQQSGVVLTDDNQIIEMVKLRVTKELPKLRYQCYERRLKQDDTVQGSWMVNFTVNKDGSVSSASATGKGTSDAPLEACIAEKVQTWTFQPIKAPLPVGKTVTFRPS